VCHEILSEFGIRPDGTHPTEGGAAYIQLNHPQLLAALLDICGVPSEAPQRAQLVSVMAKAATRRLDDWGAISSRLEQRGLCSAACARELSKYVWHRWRPSELHKLRTLVQARAPPQRRAAGLSAISSLEDCIAGAEAMGVQTDTLVLVDTRLALSHLEFSAGMQLQVSLPGHGVLLKGGRYDALRGSLAAGSAEKVAAGISIYLGKLMSCLGAADTRAGGSEVDVLVCSVGEGLALERMAIVGQLWQAGIRADASAGDSSDLRMHLEMGQEAGAQHIVIVRHSKADGSPKVSIKPMRAPASARGSRKAQAEEEQVDKGDVAKVLVRRGVRAGLRAWPPLTHGTHSTAL